MGTMTYTDEGEDDTDHHKVHPESLELECHETDKGEPKDRDNILRDTVQDDLTLRTVIIVFRQLRGGKDQMVLQAKR